MKVITVKGEDNTDSRLHYEYNGETIPVHYCNGDEDANSRTLGKCFSIDKNNVTEAAEKFGLDLSDLSFDIIDIDADVDFAKVMLWSVRIQNAKIISGHLSIAHTAIQQLHVKAKPWFTGGYCISISENSDVKSIYRLDNKTDMFCHESNIDKVYTREEGIGLYWVEGLEGPNPKCFLEKHVARTVDTLANICMRVVAEENLPIDNLPIDLRENANTCHKCKHTSFGAGFITKLGKIQCEDVSDCIRRQHLLEDEEEKENKPNPNSEQEPKDVINYIDMAILKNSRAPRKGYKKDYLVGICRKLGLPVSGNKEKVVQRLFLYIRRQSQ